MTRLSLGVQSLDDALLRRLGRKHRGRRGGRLSRGSRGRLRRRQRGPPLRQSRPGPRGFDRTLDAVLGWAPDHLSPPRSARAGHSLRPAPARGLPYEDVLVAQFDPCRAGGAAGLERYEVSNFARPGLRSRHNLLYWHRADISASAQAPTPPSAHPLRHSAPAAALARGAAGRGVADRGPGAATDREAAGERILLGLRLAEGVPRAWVEATRPLAAGPGASAVDRHVAAGLIAVRDGRVALTTAASSCRTRSSPSSPDGGVWGPATDPPIQGAGAGCGAPRTSLRGRFLTTPRPAWIFALVSAPGIRGAVRPLTQMAGSP